MYIRYALALSFSVSLAILPKFHNQFLYADFLQKQITISELGKLIAEKDTFIRTFNKNIESIYTTILNDLIDEWEQENGTSLSSEEIDEIAQNLELSINKFLKEFNAVPIEDLHDFIVNELYDQENFESITAFQPIKFLLLRTLFEKNLLAELVNLYATSVQELYQMNEQLIEETVCQ